MPKKYGMVIDLHQCVGCGACALGCKNENNTQARVKGQSYNWADFIMKTEGVFPTTTYTQMPVLCNHCSDAPCVAECPVTPKAMFKADDNTTLHNQERCIGCRACQMSCPYSIEELDASSNTGKTYSVISFNPFKQPTQPAWHDKSELIAGCTSSGAEVAEKIGSLPPSENKYQSGDYQSVRKAGVVEKCILCHHRTTHGQQPACVEACPANARIFGDLNDPSSALSKALKAHKATRLKVDEGTDPNVYYIRSYNDPKV
jgi:Fe-S-cluster-containing dehydrogenase component